MTFENIIFQTQDKIATITLNRPEKLNVLNDALMSELDSVLSDLEADSTIRVVIIKGAGRAFSAGHDVAPSTPEGKAGTETRITDIAADIRRLRRNTRRWLRIWDLSKCVIAQVHGYCLGVATQMVSMCDLTIVAEDAQIGRPRLGPLGAGIMVSEWCSLVGPKKTKEMFFNIGKFIDGKEAEQIGWANKAVPAEKLEEEVNKLACEISQTPLEILEINKTMINRYVEMSGFRTAIFCGAEMDAIAHRTRPVEHFIKMIKEKGIKAASRDWKKEID